MWPAAVVGLGLLVGPSHVSGRVVSVVVDAVDGEAESWARADVRKERGEVMPPLVADRDAASAVVLEGDIARVVAPHDHRPPTAVFLATIGEHNGMPMGAETRSSRIAMPTPAGLRAPVVDVRPTGPRSCSAVAQRFNVAARAVLASSHLAASGENKPVVAIASVRDELSSGLSKCDHALAFPVPARTADASMQALDGHRSFRAAGTPAQHGAAAVAVRRIANHGPVAEHGAWLGRDV